jgi:hypothetical protein
MEGRSLRKETEDFRRGWNAILIKKGY